MKVVHLWASAGIAGGGGGIAMARLHRALLEAGVDSTILEEPSKDLDGDPRRQAVPRWRVIDGGLRRVASRAGLNDVHRLSSFAITRHTAVRDADVLHVHGTHSGFLNYLALPWLTRGRPALFTLHDMWAVTGHCAYSMECDRWQRGCGSCPHLDTLPSVRRDATRIEWRLKREAFRRSRMAYATPSQWLADIARRGLPEGSEVACIPNGVDLDVYRPLARHAREEARDALGLRRDALVVMMSSVNLSDPRKGGDLLPPFFEAMPTEVRSRLVALLIGPRHEALASSLPVPTVALGTLVADEAKARAYAASDLFVLPTRADNDPLVLAEAMACGTPAASFDVGGVGEIVRPGETGLLAPPEDARGLGVQAAELLVDEVRRAALRERARATMVAERGLDRWVDSHLEQYQRLIHPATATSPVAAAPEG